ncbi:MAG TPA: immunoglobulin domain-containing protein [Candidatus Hydrogenedentes bacterium]|nr:immunoglobulin domain-containing protein [Candidatus Hydrogenedentota bacterium]HOT49622.1 immunoglobulin domain-containing protein [Candidatus Hydrogenedentota bacterium]HOV74090.1 immunoglobulin domain-containing protein [Candidatus Hydrogenedentota bacterium]HPC15924.1 immunoglobulin domain-containing protein [Candidatus Hydrogenedentota bacterium]HRT19878.1 immunoglobulin domain-containing protein [Candidatus Hydrogenedentota bacterium]
MRTSVVLCACAGLLAASAWAGTTAINFADGIGLLTGQSGPGQLQASSGRAVFTGANTSVLKKGGSYVVGSGGSVSATMGLVPYSDAQYGVGLIMIDTTDTQNTVTATVDGGGMVVLSDWIGNERALDFSWPAALNSMTLQYDTYSGRATLTLNGAQSVFLDYALSGASSVYVGVGSLGPGGFASFSATGNGIPDYPPPNTITPNPSGPVQEGASVSLTAPEGSGYQWKRNGVDVPSDGRHAGTQSRTLTINPVLPSDAGSYTCVYTLPTKAMKETEPYVLTVLAIPNHITANPSRFIEEGDRLSLTAPAGSDYQWKKNGLALSDTATIAGTSARTLTIDPVAPEDAGIYTCVYTTDAKAVKETEPYVLTVYAPNSIPVAGIAGTALLAGMMALGGLAAIQFREKRRVAS